MLAVPGMDKAAVRMPVRVGVVERMAMPQAVPPDPRLLTGARLKTPFVPIFTCGEAAPATAHARSFSIAHDRHASLVPL